MHACAGPLVTLPRGRERFYYFPKVTGPRVLYHVVAYRQCLVLEVSLHMQEENSSLFFRKTIRYGG